MQKKVKALAIGTGVLAAGAAVTTGVSYAVTNMLVKEALDRDEPRIMRILKRRVNGTFKETEAYRTALHLAEMLERKPHEDTPSIDHDSEINYQFTTTENDLL